MEPSRQRPLAAFVVALSSLASCTPSIEQVALRSPGDHEVAFEHRGGAREALIHVPPRVDEEGAVPLVVVLHGAGSSPSAMAEVTGFDRIADREGFVTAYPGALGIAHGMWRTWNTGGCFAPACWFGVDDVGMVATLIDELERRLPIDPTRVYLVGYSNGGALALDVAARMTERFAGLAVYAATMKADGPVIGPLLRVRRPAVPLSVMTLHAEHDPWIPRDGDERLSFTELSQAHIGQFWAASARCPQRASRHVEHDGAVRVAHYRGCAEHTEVKQLSLAGWHHEWPGPENLDCKPEGDPLRHFDAAETIWSFLRDKRRAPAAPPAEVGG